jgi:hypothetical protein
MEQVLVVYLGFSGQIQLELGDDVIVMADELEVDLDTFGCTNIGELLGYTFTISSIGDSFLGSG